MRPATTPTQRLGASITPSQLDWLDKEAKRREISKSELLRRIIDEHRDRLENAQC